MITPPFSMDRFKPDLEKMMRSKNITQLSLAHSSQVSQAAISNFLRGRRGLSCKAFLALWPFVYGRPFPEKELAALPPAKEDA